ncbi:uncharacterized protein LOC115391585 [Salarias fasciatus]|uniref:uncharacterized protein LOC115391585 n=1 Tax=Salarias fasciatus TaxID=181472 RepID=UPI00117694FC|nr:uncharacterized protein LOC115391585 [Salarias fasciatus]
MVSLWNIYSLVLLSLLLSLLVKALNGENVEKTQDPGIRPTVWFLRQRLQRPDRSDSLPMGNPITGPESDRMGQPLSWILSSSEEHDGQGVIGEYSDLQESTETSVLYNQRATEDATSEWSKQTTRSSPSDSHHEQTKYQSAEPTTATSLLHPPQTGESRLVFPTIQNKMTDSQFPFRLSGSVKSNKQDSLQPAGHGPSTEHPTAAQPTDSLGLTTGISFTTKGKIDGITIAADNILYQGTVSRQPGKVPLYEDLLCPKCVFQILPSSPLMIPCARHLWFAESVLCVFKPFPKLS